MPKVITILLTTENGGLPSNKIYLEPEVLQALMDYLEWLKAKMRDESGTQ